MAKIGALGEVKSVTADNGSEFLKPNAIRRILNCGVYYTRAYASWEKGSVENVNRMIRRWYPKGTDFSKHANAEISALQHTINSINRQLLGGQSADEYAAVRHIVNPRERPLNMKILNALPPLLRSLAQKSSHFACNSRFSVGGDPVRQVAFGEKYPVRRIHAGREHQQAHAAAAILKNPDVSREELAHGVREACRALDLDAQRIPDIVAQAERTLKREQAAVRAGRMLPEHGRLVEAVGAQAYAENAEALGSLVK